MSVNQFSGKSELQYRKVGGGGRSGSTAQHRSFVGGSGRGGGGSTAPPLPNSSSHPTSRSTHSYRKIHDAQAAQSRVNSNAPEANVDPAARTAVQNSSWSQTTPNALAPSSKPSDTSVQGRTGPIPRAPSSQSPAMTSISTLPTASERGDGAKGYALQFGSINPSVMNAMQFPARTTSAPPTLDEQTRDQACHDTFGRGAAVPAPSMPKPQIDKTGDSGIPSGEVNIQSKDKRDAPATYAPSAQQPPVFPMGGISMPLPYPHPSVSMQFGGFNPQIQSQGFPSQIQFPLRMGNPSQMQQPVFLPHQLIQAQQIMHQNQVMGFNPQMGQLPPQLGGLGMGTPPQFSRQQMDKFGSSRKVVKITHPETHEELRLDKRNGIPTDVKMALRPYTNGPSPPQNVSACISTRPTSSYANSYVGGPTFYAPHSTAPSAQLTPASQASGFGYPVSQTPHNQPASNSLLLKKEGTSVHRNLESSGMDSAPMVQILVSSASASVTVQAETSTPENGIESSFVSSGLDQPAKKEHAQASYQVGDESSPDLLPDHYAEQVSTCVVTPDAVEIDSLRPANVDRKIEENPDMNGNIRIANKMADEMPLERHNSLDGNDAITEKDPSGIEIESSKTKSMPARGKKKIKQILQKADAQGTTSDLYMAFKGPAVQEKCIDSKMHEEMVGSNLNPASAGFSQQDFSAKEKGDQSITEPGDWEDSANLSAPKLESMNPVIEKGWEPGSRKNYSRDFLLTFSEQCTNLPEGFVVTSDISGILTRPNSSSSRALDHQYHSPGRIVDRPSGGPKADRRGNGMSEADRWNRHQGPFPYPHDMGLDPGYAPISMGFRPGQVGNYGVTRHPRAQYPLLSVPMQYMQCDTDRWRNVNLRGSLRPAPMQVMHKAERRYEIGKTADEEEAKQRRLKGILNKLTPQNFDKLFAQVKEVNIDNVVTLNGVISQIFDKALMEPTFCEMYSNFCYELSLVLPELNVDDEKITFKRLLLNKCQEEFERGEREEEEANKAEAEDKTQLSAGEREERRLKARRRMLGNIRLIGELYKKRMLTERIMHECIKKLLGQYPNPVEEDIESLCNLMSTIGEMIDHPRAKQHMDVYFDMMENLSNNMKLSSRVRFMLKDSIDLRKNKWQQRRKVEGPKKIEEVHRDAAQERQGHGTRLNRGPNPGPSMRRGSSTLGNFHGPPPQLRVHAVQDVRVEERNSFDNRTVSIALPQRASGDDSITLGPQGGLTKGMSTKRTGGLNGFSSMLERTGLCSRDDSFSRYASENVGAHKNVVTHSVSKPVPALPPRRVEELPSAQNSSSNEMWPEERLREKSANAIKEFYSAKDETEVDLCVRELNAPSFYPSVISIWVTDSFERKDPEREMLNKLIINLSKPRDNRLFMPDQIIKGFESVLSNLEDTVNDAPKAPDFLGHLFAKLITENIVSLKEIGGLLRDAGDEPGRLREVGLAGDVLGSILENIKSERGETAAKDMWSNAGLQLDHFRPPDPLKSRKLEQFVQVSGVFS